MYEIRKTFLDKICHPAFENVIAGVVAWVGGSIAYLVHEEIMARGPIMDTNYKFESFLSYRPCLIGDVRPRMEEVESVDHVCIVKKRSLIKLPNLTI